MQRKKKKNSGIINELDKEETVDININRTSSQRNGNEMSVP